MVQWVSENKTSKDIQLITRYVYNTVPGFLLVPTSPLFPLLFLPFNSSSRQYSACNSLIHYYFVGHTGQKWPVAHNATLQILTYCQWSMLQCHPWLSHVSRRGGRRRSSHHQTGGSLWMLQIFPVRIYDKEAELKLVQATPTYWVLKIFSRSQPLCSLGGDDSHTHSRRQSGQFV